MKNKIILTSGLFLALMATMINPGLSEARVFGIHEGSSTPTTTQIQTARFCEILSHRASIIEKQLATIQNKIQERKADQKNRLEDQWNDYIARMNNQNDFLSKLASLDVEKLNQYATTTQEKAAVSAFQSAIQSAIETRKVAIETALNTFHQGVLALLSTTTPETAIANASNTIAAVIQQAQQDCSSTSNQAITRANFIKQMQTIMEQIRAMYSRHDLNRSSQMKALVDAKNAAIKKAQEDFRAALIAAKDNLESALSQNNPSQSESTTTPTSSSSTTQ